MNDQSPRYTPQELLELDPLDTSLNKMDVIKSTEDAYYNMAQAHIYDPNDFNLEQSVKLLDILDTYALNDDPSVSMASLLEMRSLLKRFQPTTDPVNHFCNLVIKNYIQTAPKVICDIMDMAQAVEHDAVLDLDDHDPDKVLAILNQPKPGYPLEDIFHLSVSFAALTEAHPEIPVFEKIDPKYSDRVNKSYRSDFSNKSVQVVLFSNNKNELCFGSYGVNKVHSFKWPAHYHYGLPLNF